MRDRIKCLPKVNKIIYCISCLLFTQTWLRYVRVFASANPSLVCLSVTFVHPTQGFKAFGNISLPLYNLTILWPACKSLRWHGNPSVWFSLHTARVAQNMRMYLASLTTQFTSLIVYHLLLFVHERVTKVMKYVGHKQRFLQCGPVLSLHKWKYIEV